MVRKAAEAMNKAFPFRLPMLLDGATGTMLQARGMPAGACTETWIMDNPQPLLETQALYARAGSDAVLAPTFTANSLSLAQHGVTGRTAELNGGLVALSRKAVEGKALVGGDLTATGRMLEPYGDVTFELLYEAYYEQAQALEAAGVDFFDMETTTHLAEARAALLACRAASDKPVFVTFTCDSNGRTFCGTDVLAALLTLQAMGASAFGLNCSAGPEQMLPQLQRLGEYAAVPLIAKPNAGLPETVDGKTVYRLSPQGLAQYVPQMAQAGVRIFGGCCGTTEQHIAALRQAVDELALPALDQTPPQGILTTERKVFRLEDLTWAEPIPCTEDFDGDAMDADEEEVLQVLLDSDQALENFLAGCYGVCTPLCLVTDDVHRLEQALRAYQGLACCRADCGISPEELARLQDRYGLVIAN